MAEIDAFRSCFVILKTGLKHELNEFVGHLLARDLITQCTLEKATSVVEPVDKRTNDLLCVLLDKIRTDSTSLGSILGVLDDCRLQTLASNLRGELRQAELKNSVREKTLKGPAIGAAGAEATVSGGFCLPQIIMSIPGKCNMQLSLIIGCRI